MNEKQIQLWGGLECTINRVGDQYFSQLELSGHWQRPDDLERIAELGVRTLRYPVLWESVSPESPDCFEWSRSDAALQKLRALGIRPIVGLLHHGSGPRYTDLLDPEFPEKLARFATAVAQRYPWVDAYTPINEPLTTARFSGLYGHWYPHRSDDASFMQALLNECRGTVLAMEAIRAHNPEARLVQTEDVGRIFSSPRLQYQADFENERRWLTWDLLAGALTADHPMMNYLEWIGADQDQLRFLAENPCRPDVLGINYYVTSERYLDEEFEKYPMELWGGNGREKYADDAAARARPEGLFGIEGIIGEVHRRYHLPIAITEAHLGCSEDDEQIRWFVEIWNGAHNAQAKGADLQAVTSWALLGSFGWNNLAVHLDGHYEAGAFEVLNDGSLRSTRLADFLKQAAQDGPIIDSLFQRPGWWHHPSRLRFQP
jgi:dTDP-4-dehydrorhamnose reductase